MIAADIIGILKIFLITHPAQALQDLAPLGGMGLHDLKLFRRQASGLVEDTVLNGNLAYVMKG